MTENYIAVCQLDNEIEVQMIDNILEENGIPHLIQESDSAALPVYDLTEGYATLYADEEYADEIKEIISEMRNNVFDAKPAYEDDDDFEDDEE